MCRLLTAASLEIALGSLLRAGAHHSPRAPGDILRGKGGLCQPGLAPAQEQHSPPALSCAIHRTPYPQRSARGMLVPGGWAALRGSDLCVLVGKHRTVPSASTGGERCLARPCLLSCLPTSSWCHTEAEGPPNHPVLLPAPLVGVHIPAGRRWPICALRHQCLWAGAREAVRTGRVGCGLWLGPVPRCPARSPAGSRQDERLA